MNLSNNPISDYFKLAKSLSTIPNLKELKLDLTTVEKVEIVLRNLPNLKKLNDKEIKPDLFSEENIDEKNSKENIDNNDNNFEQEENKLSDNINNINNNISNDKIINEREEIEENNSNLNEIELPDSSIESELHNYDVSNILFRFIITYRK